MADEGEKRFGLVPDLQRREPDRDRDHQQLQDVEGQAGGRGAIFQLCAARQGQAVAGNQPFEEVEPAAIAVGLADGERGAAQACARFQQQADGDADADRDQAGDGEPEEGLAGKARGIVERAQIGDRRDDGGEDQRRHHGLEQRHEDRAQRLERGGEPVEVAVRPRAHLSRDKAQQQADDHADQNLEPETAIIQRHDAFPLGRTGAYIG